jgi:hypothetical protein
MAGSSCCGKKQKLNGTNHQNGIQQNFSIANAEMCFYCFEVLHCELNRKDFNIEPEFTNQAL